MGAADGAGGVPVAEAWAREVLARPGVEAAEQRLGEDGVRELVRGARGVQGGPEARDLVGIGRALAAAGEGRRAYVGEQERASAAERDRLALRREREMRM